MNERPEELKRHFGKAAEDTAWLEKLRAAATWEEYEKLLNEKGIVASTESKEVFEAGKSRKFGELSEDELLYVAGGYKPILRCPQEYDFFLCQFTGCPHLKRDEYTPDDKHYTYQCNLHRWKEEFSY